MNSSTHFSRLNRIKKNQNMKRLFILALIIVNIFTIQADDDYPDYTKLTKGDVIIMKIDNDASLDTMAVYFREVSSGEYDHYVECKLSCLNYKPIKTLMFKSGHPYDLNLTVYHNGAHRHMFNIIFNCSGLSAIPYCTLSFYFIDEEKKLQLVGVEMEDQLNNREEEYSRYIKAELFQGEWIYNTYVVNNVTETMFVSEDYYDAKRQLTYARCYIDKEEYEIDLQTFSFVPPSKNIYFESVSKKIFLELFRSVEKNRSSHATINFDYLR